MNCFNETFEMEVITELEDLCHGEFQCTYTIPTVPLDPICDGMKREARIEFSCGKSFQCMAVSYAIKTHSEMPLVGGISSLELCLYDMKELT